MRGVDRIPEPYLGDCCGEPMPPPRANPWKSPQTLGRIERIIQTAVTLLGITALALLVSIIVLLAFSVLTNTPLHAAEIQYPVPIPSECVDLAQRKGEPLMVESHRQGLKAKAKLAMLSAREPGVRECRAAVHRLEQEMKAP